MSEHMSDATFGKVFATMIAGMVALTIVLIIIAYAVGGGPGSERSDVRVRASNLETSARTAPVASVAVGEVTEVAAVSDAPVSGESVYRCYKRGRLQCRRHPDRDVIPGSLHAPGPRAGPRYFFP